MPVLVSLVEGQSEERAMGGLIRRIVATEAAIEIARPFRVKRNKVVRACELERAVQQVVRARAGASGILIVLDADGDCPAELAPNLVARARAASGLPVGVVLPSIEIEAWILGGIESVRGVRGISPRATCPDNVERIRDAKSALTTRMEGSRGYVATDDLPAFLARLDLDLAASRCPSMAKFIREVQRLCQEGA